MRRFVGIVILLAFLSFCIVWLIEDPDVRRYTDELERVSGIQWIALLALKVAIALLTAIKFKYSISLLDCELRWLEWVGLPAFNTMAGYASPFKLGWVGNAVYLSKHYGINPAVFLGTKLAVTMTDSLSGAAVLLIAFTSTALPILDRAIGWAIGAGFTVLLAGNAVVALSAKFGSRGGWLPQKFSQLSSDVWRAQAVLRKRPAAVAGLMLQNVALFVLKGTALFVCVGFLGLDSSLIYCIAVMVFVSFSGNIAVSPGNLGLTEGLIAGGLMLAGVSTDGAIAVSLLSRASSLVVQIPMGVAAVAIYSLSGARFGEGDRRRSAQLTVDQHGGEA